MMPLDPEPAPRGARVAGAGSGPPATEAEASPTPPGRAAAVVAVLTAMTLVVLDAGMMNLALPAIAGAFRAPAALAVLVVTAYQTALLAALLPCAALGERLGYRPVFALGVGLFVIASGLCALAPSLPWLVAARALQGLGGAAVMALGVPLLRFAVPSHRLGAAIGWNALTVALASSAGPGAGALILSQGDWRWLFAPGVPLGLAVLLACRALPRTPMGAQRLDGISMALSAGVFASLLAAAQLLLAQPVAAALLAAAGVLALRLLLSRERPKAAPLLPLDLLRGRSLRLSVIASVLCFSAQAAALVALPFYLQHGLGQTTAATGGYMTAWPLSVAMTAVVAGRLADRFPTAWLCAAGGACLALGLAGAALWPLTADVRPMVVFAMMCGLGFGLFQTPNNRNMFLSAPLERSAASGGLQGTARLTGQTAGAVLMVVLFTLTSLVAAPRLGLGIAAALALLAGLVSLSRTTSGDRVIADIATTAPYGKAWTRTARPAPE
ncbi:MFS transporter [Brevundimonas sp.]|uniref:MFS transporter n=1 Tax=Brevundimonas sp. TaxID=1871086 RepID=UPI002D534731|nr:MFS transporter [Brevundimonas sp.]HYC67436.1 MFS transporter [Brevundimonas sp.]